MESSRLIDNIKNLKSSKDIDHYRVVSLAFLLSDQPAPCDLYFFQRNAVYLAVEKDLPVDFDCFTQLMDDFYGIGFIRTQDQAAWDAYVEDRHPQDGEVESIQPPTLMAVRTDDELKRIKKHVNLFVNYGLESIRVTTDDAKSKENIHRAAEIFRATANNRVIDWFFLNWSIDDLFNHNSRVSYLCTLYIAFTFPQLDEEVVETLIISGMIHQLVGTLDGIQKAPPSRETLDLIKEKAYPIPDRILKIISQHDERFDGSGAPLGTKGGDISLFSRVFSLPDTYDHVRMKTPAQTRRESLEATKNAMQALEKAFDPRLWKSFWTFMEKVEFML